MTALDAERCLWRMYLAGLISKYTWTRATREVRRHATEGNEEGTKA